MAFENQPLEEFKVPDTAVPGIAGFHFTAVIPAALSAYYTDANSLAVVRIGYTSSTNLYWYEGFMNTGTVVVGWVLNTSVSEYYRLQKVGDVNYMWYNFDSIDPLRIVMGPNNGMATSPNAQMIFQRGYDLHGTLDSSLTWFGPVTLNGDTAIEGAVSFGHASMATWEASDDTVLTPFTNTGGVVGFPIVGVSFVAPPSGAVMISVGGNIWQATTGFRTNLGWELKTGSTINGGDLVKGPDYRYSLMTGRVGVSDTGATRRRKWGGLTPGQSYNVVTKHWVSGGTGALDQREIIVEPVL